MKAEAQARGLLAALVAEAERRIAVARSARRELERAAAHAGEPPDFGAALTTGASVAVIAEIKRKSPSAGVLWEEGDVASLAGRLEGAGASALSVLTEPRHFGGALDDLSRAAAAARIPVLRKDFILDPVQLYEARAHGAAAVLLIVRILEPGRLADLAGAARRLGLGTLVEVHGAAELDAALAAQPTAVGVNARDLDTLALNRGLVEELLERVPADRVAVAESGLSARTDVEAVARRGADAVLVGAAITGARDPAAALRALSGVARAPGVRAGRRA
jgi:indole-3-glycerol phosphate synthase